jgi:hypothetical protein
MLAFLVQLLGASTLWISYAAQPSVVFTQQNGLNVLRAGILLQVLTLGVFLVIGLRFRVLSTRWNGDATPFASASNAQWTQLLHIVGSATFLIAVRIQ